MKPTTENSTIVTDQTAPLAALKAMTAQEQLEYVQRQVFAAEMQTARAWQEFYEAPTDDQTILRLMYGRYLFTTLRLKEHTL